MREYYYYMIGRTSKGEGEELKEGGGGDERK